MKKFKKLLLSFLVVCSSASLVQAVDKDYTEYDNVESIQATDEFLLYRPGVGLVNWLPSYFFIDNGGNSYGLTSLTLANTGLHLLDTNGDADIILSPTTNLTADRIISLAGPDAAGVLPYFTDPNADSIFFWDDSAGVLDEVTIGSGLDFTAGVLTSTGGGGSGDVTATSNITDNAIVRGDGGVKGVQESLVTISDTGSITGTSSSSTCLSLGPNGATAPVLSADCSTASQDIGVKITGSSAGSDYGAISCTATDGTCNMMIRGLGSTRGVNIDADGDLGSDYVFRKHYYTFVAGTNTTASQVRFGVTSAADTSLSAGTEALNVKFDLSAVRSHSSNTAITNQRDFQILGTTHAFSSSGGVITNASTLYVTPPIAGTNATLTNANAIHSTGNIKVDGKITQDSTNTAGGTTGNQTINKPTGTVNFAAGASSLTVTNSLVTTNSIVLAVVRTNDATAQIKNVVPGSGSFVINLSTTATAETSVGFMVLN